MTRDQSLEAFSGEEPSVEERIIYAAIECIEEYGLQGATNRKIAARAGVNGAAINYYFRSKEKLIEKGMGITLDNDFDWEDFAQMPGDTAVERCVAIFDDIIEGACNYPGLTRAHYFALVTEGNYQSPAALKMNEFLGRLVEDLKEKGTGLEDNELEMAVSQIMATAMMMSLMPQLAKKQFGIDMADAEIRKKFLQRLVEQLL